MAYGGIIGQQFDGYTQNQTLTQAVAALYGLGTDAVPNDVFNILSKSALYKNTPTTGLYTPTDQLIMSIPSTGFSPASVVTGSYVGTGTYGEENKISFSFGKKPKFFSIYNIFNSYSGDHWDQAARLLLTPIPWMDNGSYQYYFSSSGAATIIFNGNELSIYSTNSSWQMNNDGYIYYYYAIL